MKRSASAGYDLYRADKASAVYRCRTGLSRLPPQLQRGGDNMMNDVQRVADTGRPSCYLPTAQQLQTIFRLKQLPREVISRAQHSATDSAATARRVLVGAATPNGSANFHRIKLDLALKHLIICRDLPSVI